MTQNPDTCSCTVDRRKALGTLNCSCGEEMNEFEWAFEMPPLDVPVLLTKERREVKFHPSVSLGTVGLRGDEPLVPGRHYLWEIKMLNNVFGTDIMVGIGTPKVNLNKLYREFKSLLGSNRESWGFSYKGKILHNGFWEDYGCTFGKGSIIAVHLDLRCGVLEFYINRKYMGVAFHLQPQILYPMVSSTAANSTMRLISCSSWRSSLQFYCLRSLSSKPSIMEQLISIPGIRAEWGSALWGLLVKGKTTKEEKDPRTDEQPVGNNSTRRSRIVLVSSSSSEESSLEYERRTRRVAKRKCKRKRRYLRKR